MTDFRLEACSSSKVAAYKAAPESFKALKGNDDGDDDNCYYYVCCIIIVIPHCCFVCLAVCS